MKLAARGNVPADIYRHIKWRQIPPYEPREIVPAQRIPIVDLKSKLGRKLRFYTVIMGHNKLSTGSVKCSNACFARNVAEIKTLQKRVT